MEKYLKEEERCLDYFHRLVKHLKEFKQWASTAYGCSADVICLNITGGTSAVELKWRKPYALRFNTLFIEPGKLDYLLRLWRDKGIWTYYINFFGDKDYCWLFFIPGIEHLVGTFNIQENITIHENGGSELKKGDRVELPFKYGYKIDINTGEVLAMAEDNTRVPPPIAHNLDLTKSITREIIEEL